MFGFLKKAAKFAIAPAWQGSAWAAGKAGIHPLTMLGMTPQEIKAQAYQNPEYAHQYKTDQNRSNYYDKQAVGAFGGMNTAGRNINRNAAGYGGLISRLSDMGNGVGPSLAQMQLQQATNRNIQNQAGIAASNQGYNPAMAARLMGQNVAGMNQEAAGQSGQLRLQEQMDAMNQEIAARQAQGQAYGMAGNLYGNQAQLGLTGGANYQGMAEDLAEKERQAKIALETGQVAANDKAVGRRLEFISKIGQAVGAAAVSDENVKKDIHSGDKDIQTFLDAIAAHSYKYNDEVDEDDKEHVSPMAQELEKTKIGKGFVFNNKGVKNIDYGKMAGVLLASQAMLNKRLNEIEKR